MDVKVTYREYTTDGRFFYTSTRTVNLRYLDSFIRDLFSVNDSTHLHAHYVGAGLLREEERIKPLWPTNVTVRSADGKFLPWKHLGL